MKVTVRVRAKLETAADEKVFHRAKATVGRDVPVLFVHSDGDIPAWTIGFPLRSVAWWKVENE